MNVEIVIGQRGWVWVGEVLSDTPYELKLRARCVSRWGTKRGLAELVRGPTKDTALDDIADTKIHPLAVVARIVCDGDAWLAHL